MSTSEMIVAVFPDHHEAEDAIKLLTTADFKMQDLSLVGKGFRTEEKVVGFYNAGDRIKFWGSRGAFWGGFWGIFLGGVFLTVPIVGPVVVLGYLAAIVVSAIESAVMVGGVSAIGAALYSIGIPKNSVIQYEAEIKSDGFLVMARGSASQIAHAKELLELSKSYRVDIHTDVDASDRSKGAIVGSS